MADNIAGLASLQNNFKLLTKDMEVKTAARMVAAGGGVLRKEARALAEKQGLRKTGAMIKNIAIKRERNVPAGTVQYNLGVRHGKDLGKKYKQLGVGKNGRIRVTYKDNPFYWSFNEFGHRIVGRDRGQTGGGVTSFTVKLSNGRLVRRTRKYRNSSLVGRRKTASGFVPAKPFIGPVLVNKQAEAIRAMEIMLQKDLDKYKAGA